MDDRLTQWTAGQKQSRGEKLLWKIEWQAVREAASRLLPKHTAAAGWKRRNLSHVEQEELAPMPKDRGAEHGEVGGPLECSPWEWLRLKHEDT